MDDIVFHINATPEFYQDKKAMKAMKEMIRLAYKMEDKKPLSGTISIGAGTFGVTNTHMPIEEVEKLCEFISKNEFIFNFQNNEWITFRGSDTPKSFKELVEMFKKQ